jgi:hypothetical protein
MQCMVMYQHETIELFLYEFTEVCTGCHNLHNVNTTCNLNPAFIGTDMIWNSNYSRKMIPLPSLAWDHHSPNRWEPGNITPSLRFTRWPNPCNGYFLGRLGNFLAPLTSDRGELLAEQYQIRWYIDFKIQACDKTREWHLSVLAHKVALVMEEVSVVMRASRDPQASLRLSTTRSDVTVPSQAMAPLELYIRLWNEPSQDGDGPFFPVCPNVQRP